MKLYFHEVEKARPCILIVPGRYAVVSPSEGEIVAKKFYEMGYQTASAKPNAVILSYPVITSGDCAHRGSFTALLGADASEEELEYMSLEKQVTEDMPPCFCGRRRQMNWFRFRIPSYLHRRYRKEDSLCIPCIFKREAWIVTC